MTWQWRKRAGVPPCTQIMYDVLTRMVANGGVMRNLQDTVHPNTLHGLQRHGMIDRTEDGSHVVYNVTETGYKTQLVYSLDRAEYGPRKDDICPDCGTRKRHRYSGGRSAGYCKPCRNKRAVVYSQRCRARRMERYAYKLLGGNKS